MARLANDRPDPSHNLPGTTYGLPLSAVIAIDALTGAKTLAGSAGSERTVTGLNVMEVPDVLGWVKPHELLVTTGFPLLDTSRRLDVNRMLALVRGLHDAGLAGFAIKLGRYVDQVPESVLALADDLGFPIVQIPDEVAFDDVLRDAYAALNAFQSHVLAQIDALHSALTQIVLEGGDLDQIAAEVSQVLDVGVLVTSTDGREWAGALSDDVRASLEVSEFLDVSGRVRVERMRTPRPFGVGEIRSLHVAASGTELARLVVLSERRSLRASDVYALERAATVAALLITRMQAVVAVEGKYRGDFLRDVLTDRAESPQYVLEHARGLGWELDRPLVVVVAQLDPPGPGDAPVSGRSRRGFQDRFAAAWRQVVERRGRSIAVADFSSQVVALLPVAEDGSDVGEVVEEALAAVRGDSGGGRRSFSAGISRVVTEVEAFPDAYARARKAVDVGRRMKGDGSTTYFDRLGVRRLLSQVEDQGELDAFVVEVLGPLAQATAAAADLRATLQVLLDVNLNVAEAARTQHFHYNTMRYRVTKLESILGPFSTDPEVRLDVAVALQILQMRE
ncbi:PucR family transcriptional regulator ligand-binding domain-containing protein [Mumia sp. zg.B17]|uniref:PucR family transcriptional regulator n=1 Tax=Mumia sp. zg.B17 TaxID=2855446 RepID=UPI001C6F5703|nr:PucR family transcriptional regulator ligand-binding domain-containing protein [Mumia sp. zg.B17]MBW9206754.1 PucR family transcriptional regulator ligand-binding domain-containing protein [Mumia sp. zg.B17]